MIGYSLYFFLVVGLSVLLTAAFRRLRQDDRRIAPPEEDTAFDRRMAKIEARYGGSKNSGEPRSDKVE